MKLRNYHELKQLKTFDERFHYLRLTGVVGESTFGFDRYLNQIFYKSNRWRTTRRGIIIRDNGCDLGVEGYDIHDLIIIHHVNQVTEEDIELDREWLYDPEFLISSSSNTHRAIHFGDESLLPRLPIVRKKNDTCPWR